MRAVVKDGTAWATLNAERLPGLVLTLGCLLLLLFLFCDPRFFVYGVQVSGHSSLPAEVIYQASGIDTQSAFFIAPGLVAQRLLERLPGLATARVALDLPARVNIHVDERQAEFVWQAAGQTYLVDGRGTVIGCGDAPPDALLIRCTEGCSSPDEQAPDPAVFSTASELSELLGGLRGFYYSPRFGLSLRTVQGWLVHFGVGGDLRQKVAVMQSLEGELLSNGIQPQFLDVGVPSRPYYR